MPIFLFAAAGALIFGGYAVLDEANHQRAASQARRRQDLEAELLRKEIDLEELRTRAREAGLDPQKVVDGYLALRSGDITVEQVQRVLNLAA